MSEGDGDESEVSSGQEHDSDDEEIIPVRGRAQ